ncbi:TauD/TfdA family dioxygenase [Frankia sp. CNm7]|uniref:TauD/TfdA family dioxygenase n=1 Tax=Frankia nepalensis TaxID=1836974 RepID=A0A937UTZ9_9ACTN|nr:TauD/TfdA family dioxygenase [Frankia nepalensis]MBL7502073.1 TauD/TfdA family dioxygenase [Frankia nepalensis]MBL7511807.1 TauD/TfdA family dioxygenase [Frankia nepalensis]MBL7524771.1 TauD/TfdA family dioxygenase [Frankia nepalensis]MBL7630571.1 TauD/TfdA family dioxygenase [Frankia nepalensis]
MAVTFTKLGAQVGVEITGLSGHELVDQKIAVQCQAALARYGVVVYREVHIGDADLVAFSRMLGTVVVAPMGGDSTYPEISAISLDPAQSTLAAYRRGTFFWHIDGVTDEVPQKATLLTARQVADSGGDTEFASTYAAYEALTDAEKDEYANLRVLHTFTASQLLANPDPTPKQRAAWERAPSRVQPLVWTRGNGRRSLLVGATTDHVVGMAADESRALLDRLLEWSTQPRFTLRHQWRQGDLVVWDNTGMLHRAQPYTAQSRRLMHRTTLVGEETVA